MIAKFHFHIPHFMDAGEPQPLLEQHIKGADCPKTSSGTKGGVPQEFASHPARRPPKPVHSAQHRDNPTLHNQGQKKTNMETLVCEGKVS